MTDKRLINIDRAHELHNKPFRLTAAAIKDGEVSLREEYRTGFHYNTTQVKTGKGQHMIGYLKDGKFFTRQRYKKDDFKEDNWDKYMYTHPETNRQTNYFEKLFVMEIELSKPEVFMAWDKDAKREVPGEFDGAYIAIKDGLRKKLLEAMNDPRSNKHDYYVISYDARAAPANMYTVKWHSLGKPFEVTPTTTTTMTPEAPQTTTPATAPVTPGPRIKVFPHELALLDDIRGDEATKEVLVEYLRFQSTKTGVSLTPERMTTIADAVIINGKVTF